MYEETIAPDVARTRAASRGTDPSTTTVDTETRQASLRRLGATALIYAITYAIAFGSDVVLHYNEGTRRAIFPCTVAILLALACSWLIRSGRIHVQSFSKLAVAFQVVSTLGIIVAGWRWEHVEAGVWQRFAEALGYTGESLLADFVRIAQKSGFNLLSSQGPGWIGVWLVAYPMIIRISPRVTLLGGFFSTTTVIAYTILSVLVNGVPDLIRPWVGEFIVGTAIAWYVCVLVAFLSSRTLHQLARDLTKARRMGSYRLVEKIGEGGMGSVWRAEHAMLARPAAIKVIQSSFLGTEEEAARTAMLRFEREAQATADLASPHSIRLYDFGRTAEGAFYYVMELLNGLDLRTLIAKHGPIPVERAIHILRQVCHSLYDAHTAGLIHRDIKPANVFICRCGADYDFVKVLDFGMVKRTEDKDRAASQLTVEGFTGGTPAFMSPEMAQEKHDIDGRSDLYSLGCVAFWLLTGRLVFEGKTAMEILVKHVRDTPPVPSLVSEMEIPQALDRIILDCLAKDPSKRPNNARELERRLGDLVQETAASHGDEKALASWSEEQARRWWETHLPEVGRTAGGLAVAPRDAPSLHRQPLS